MAQSELFYTANKELPSSTISSMRQDTLGNIWLATERGLCMYDGAKFKNYNNSLLDNVMLTSLCISKDGLIYVGFNEGMKVLNPATDEFSDIDFSVANNKNIKVHVRSIIQLENKEILIGTLGHGLFSLKGGTHKACQVKPDRFGFFFIDALFEDKSKNVWIATERKGLIRMQGGSKISTIKNTEKMKFSSISQASSDILFIGSEKGVYRFNIRSHTMELIHGTENDIIVCLSVHNGQLLIGTESRGLKIYDIANGVLRKESLDIVSINQSKSKINSILIDRASNCWLGINRKGLLMKPTVRNNFHYMGARSVNGNIIGDNGVNAVFKDSDGLLWVATDNDGIYCIDENGKQKAHFSNDNGSNIPNSVVCFCEDKDGKIWIGSLFNGLATIDKKSGRCKYAEELNGISVCGLAVDRWGRIWAGTMGSGLYQLDNKGKVEYKAPMYRDKQYNPKADVLNNSWICSLLISNDDRLYISTCYGLGCLDLKSKSYISSFKRNCILLGTTIHTAIEDGGNHIWFGTSNGLYRLNPKDGKVNRYGTENGLGCSIVYGIAEDRDKNIWISTLNGLSKFDISKKRFTNFYASDGLQGNEFSPRAFFKDSKGVLYFGGVNGLTFFNPSTIVSSIREIDVRVTDLYIHDMAVNANSISGGHKIIEKTQEGRCTYRLGANDNSFCIEFATNSFCNTESVIYEYSLNDKSWNTLQPGVNKVYFSNMNAGKYLFKIRANNHGVQSSVCEVDVIIDHHWYVTWWAIIFYTLAVLMILSYIYYQIKRRRTIKEKLNEQAQKEKINEAKLQFFINISHEIRTPMTLIIGPLKKLIAMDKDDECQKLYHTIYRSADRILMLVNQLMDIRKIDKGQMVLRFQQIDIIPFIKKNVSLFDESLKMHNITFRFDSDETQKCLFVDPQYLDKVIVNLMSNALKYTPDNGIIGVTIRNITGNGGKEECEIEVYDNGIGISSNDIERIFDRFYQINNNLNDAKIGTGVGLHLTKSLVELHHGHIWAENMENDKGVRFVIHLPVGRAHLSDNEIVEEKKEVSLKEDRVLVEVASNESVQMMKSKCKRSLLIVEDDADIRSYLHDELCKEFQVCQCTNGKEALQQIFENMPDLVISDIMMPVMDGISLCRKLKQNIQLNHIPVILLTAKSGDTDTIEGLNIGADAYMTKPFNIQVLHSTIVNLIVNREKLKNIYQGEQVHVDKTEKIDIKSPDDKLMERVMKYMNRNLSDSEYTVEMLAKDVGLSRVHLHRKLKEMTNQTTQNFMRNLRLQKAAELLNDKKMSVLDVSIAVGFRNITHFSSAFKELYGISPKEYRDKQ